MPEHLAMNLKNMKVMGDDGTEIGELQNITCDLDTGRLTDLVINPSETGEKFYNVDPDGYLRIPSSEMTSVQDYIVVKQ